MGLVRAQAILASRSFSESNNTYRLVVLWERVGAHRGMGVNYRGVTDAAQGFGPARDSGSSYQCASSSFCDTLWQSRAIAGIRAIATSQD